MPRQYVSKIEMAGKEAAETIKKNKFVKRERAQTYIHPKGIRHGGRQKGTPNRLPALLKDALIEAATRVGMSKEIPNYGARDGVVNYLTHQALTNSQSFLPLLGKVLPLELDTNGAPLMVVDNFEFHVIDGSKDGTDYAKPLAIEGEAEVLTIDPASEVQGSVRRQHTRTVR